MILFKYVSNPDFILEDGYIRATQLSALNDPFEASYSKEDLIKLSLDFENTIKENELIDFIEKEKHKVGIISFTQTKDNLLMWAHYANEHKGVLIGFNFSNYYKNIFVDLLIESYDVLLGTENLFDGRCIPINYRKQPIYKNDKFDRDYSNIAGEGENRILYEIFQQKSDEWIYEKEHRITLKLNQADKVILHNIIEYQYDKLNWISDLKKLCKYEENKKEDTLIFYLDSIIAEEDDEYGYNFNRFFYGNYLADLAKDNPENIYLFKIDSSCICSITNGYNVDTDNIFDYQYPKKTGYFEIYTAHKSKDNYCLEFEEITN